MKVHIPSGGYEDSATSPTFPTVDVKTVLPEYVEHAWKAGSSGARREFEQYLQGFRGS